VALSLFPFSVNRDLFSFAVPHELKASFNQLVFFCYVFSVRNMPFIAFKVYKLSVNHCVFDASAPKLLLNVYYILRLMKQHCCVPASKCVERYFSNSWFSQSSRYLLSSFYVVCSSSLRICIVQRYGLARANFETLK